MKINKKVAKKISKYLTAECYCGGFKIKFIYIAKVEPDKWSINYKKTIDSWVNAPICHRLIDDKDLKKYE